MTRSSLISRVGTVLVISLVAFGAACGDDDDDTEAASQPTPTTAASNTSGSARIVIEGFAFLGIEGQPANAPFTVENKDSVPHTVTSVDGKFPVWAVAAGETKTFGSLAPGSYAIRCDLHPSRMTGTLVVR
jgi:hypothetical protein